MAQYFVDFKDSTDETLIENFLTNNNSNIIKTYNLFTKTFLVECSIFPIDSNNITEFIIENDSTDIIPLETNRIIISDKTYGYTNPDDPTVTVNQEIDNDWWKIVCIREYDYNTPSLTFNRSGSNTIVYVLDSGISIEHPEFINSKIENLFSFNNNFTDNHGHGTAIASVINGQNCGVSNCTVKSVKIFDSTTSTKQSDIINALESIYLDSINYPNKNKIVNCSWTINKNEFIESKLRYLIQKGIFIVCSAGNSGRMILNTTPASMEDVLTIGSFGENLVPSDFSNYSAPNAIYTADNQVNYGYLNGWAPGEKIYAATNNNGYALTAGTSIAAAIHSAVLAFNFGLLNDYPLHVLNQEYFTFAKGMSLSQHGLLDLTDAKYSDSVNSISSMRFELPWNSDLTIAFKCIATSGKTWFQRICDSNKVKQLEIEGDLPEGVDIYPNMNAYGKAPEVTELYLKTVKIKVTDLYDLVHNVDLTFVVLPLDWNLENSTGDSNIDYVLQACSRCYDTTGLGLSGAGPSGAYCEGPPDYCCDGSGCTLACQTFYSKLYCQDRGYTVCICGEHF
jgi:hypothetical protein